MTKNDIKKAALAYIERQGTAKDEWYTTDKEIAEMVLMPFLLDLNIDITDEVDGVA